MYRADRRGGHVMDGTVVEHQSFAFFFTEDENEDDNSKMRNGDTYVDALLPIHLHQ